MKRTYIKDLKEYVGKEVSISGFVHTIRVQSKIIFIILRDITGLVQLVVMKDNVNFDLAKDLSSESVIKISGTVKEEKNAIGGVEIHPDTLLVLSKSNPELPIPVVTKKGNEETEAPIRFDYRWLDLRKPEKAKIFKVWTILEKGFRDYYLNNNFIQVYSPSFMSTPSETGAEVFEVKYFDRLAYLAQSPQFYKQMAIASGFERVFMMGPIFRAEESFTTRHMTEFTGWDFEIGYIDSHHDIMDNEEGMIVSGMEAIKQAMPDFDITIPQRPFPRIPIVEAKKILKDRGFSSGEEHDLSPEEEKGIWEYVKETKNHDFVFITDYHKSKSAFYHMRHENDNDRSKRAEV
jgi:aspartyl-tRNA synthetase